MAVNQTGSGYHKVVACDSPATPASGDPVRFGISTGVALTDEGGGGNASGYTTVDFGPSEWELSVHAVNDSGNSAVVAGNAIFYTDADDTKLSKKASGYLFGIAMEAVGSGSTAAIKVFKIASPASGVLGSGTAENLTVTGTETIDGGTIAFPSGGGASLEFGGLTLTEGTDYLGKTIGVTLAAATVAMSLTNATGKDLLVERLTLVQRGSVSGATLDIGTASTPVTSDNLIDGVALSGSSGIASNISDGGSNGKDQQLWPNGQCLQARVVGGAVTGLTNVLAMIKVTDLPT